MAIERQVIGTAERAWRALTRVPRALPSSARLASILFVAVLTLVALFAHRLPQPTAYHLFADTRTYLGIPNFMNVASNLAFLAVGLVGVVSLLGNGPARGTRGFYLLLFAALIAVCTGSMYYHWKPDHARLFWDRAPMTVAFSAFLAATVADRFDLRSGSLALSLALAVTLGSLVYWRVSVGAGNDNVWPYFVSMYGAIAIALLLIVLFPSHYPGERHALAALAIFAVAMAFDSWLDAPLYKLGAFMSGHTLKHLLAALAMLWLWWRMLRGRPWRTAGP